MSDIVQWLRIASDEYGMGRCDAAADDIEDLRAENERLRAALLSAEKESKYEHFEQHIDRLGDEVRALRAALEKMQRSRDRYRQAWEAEKTRAALAQGGDA